MSYHHLSRSERKKIANMYRIHFSIRRIAGILGRSASTISREIRRNSERGKYRSSTANERYAQRRLNCKPKGKLCHEELAGYPGKADANLVARADRRTAALREDMRVSHSSIYRWLHQAQLDQAAALEINLRHHGKRHGEKRGKTKFVGVRELKERSKKALRRQRLGDWEVDTIVSSSHRHTECLLSFCDRKSRYCGLVLLKNKRVPEVMRGFHFLFDDPKLPLTTVTSDRGPEFTCYKQVDQCWNIHFYFARPRSPWQKPSVENLNGLVRQFFPKGTNFHEIDPLSVANVMSILNNRPRKSLGFKTPAEVLHLA